MNNPKYIIRKGESLSMEIPVISDETGLPIDVSVPAVTNILVTLSNKGTIFAKYSLITLAGWGKLTTSTSIISLLVTREETQTWEQGFGIATITVESDDLVLGHSVYDFEYTNFVQIYPSSNSTYILTH